MDVMQDISELVEPMLKRRLYVCMSEPVASPDEILPHIPAHIRYLLALEKQGALFAAGPFLEDGEVGLRAMFIIRAADAAHAHALAGEEPLHKLGLRSFSIDEWQLNEGRISVHVDFSDQSGGLDGIVPDVHPSRNRQPGAGS